ncbi:MAG: helix-turn-helix domain-containing protein [Chitinivibrionales bacterium]|nr:helix-turn-helix domain-containing protein [Chitinivibrionales bacterium]
MDKSDQYGIFSAMEHYEVRLSPPPLFTHAGVAHGLPGYVHRHRESLDVPELFLIEKGRLFIEDDGRRAAAGPGAVIFHPEGACQRGYRPSPDGVTFVWVHFRGDIRPRALTDRDESRIRELMCHAQQQATATTDSVLIPRVSRPVYFPEMVDLGYRLAQREPRLAVERTALVTLLLARLSVSRFVGGTPGPARRSHAVVEKAKFWIDKHTGQPCSVADIAARVGLNPDYLNRVFKNHTGLAVSVYLRLRRLERARRLLISGASVKEAAARSGFADPAYFSRAFRAHTGVAPSVYARVAGDYARN